MYQVSIYAPITQLTSRQEAYPILFFFSSKLIAKIIQLFHTMNANEINLKMNSTKNTKNNDLGFHLVLFIHTTKCFDCIKLHFQYSGLGMAIKYITRSALDNIIMIMTRAGEIVHHSFLVEKHFQQFWFDQLVAFQSLCLLIPIDKRWNDAQVRVLISSERTFWIFVPAEKMEKRFCVT